MSTVLKIRNQDLFAEILIVFMCCFAPWPYGSVDAWAEYILYAGLVVIIGLRLIADWRAGERSLGSGPLYWALLAIVGIGLLQAVPLSEQTIRSISPGTVEARSANIPKVLETVRGDDRAPVGGPASTISLDPCETWHGLVRVAAIFLLFDCASRSRLRYAMLPGFARFLALNATLLALFAMAQGLKWNGKIFWIRPTYSTTALWGGPFFLHNHLAASLNMGLGLSLGLLFKNLEQGRLQGQGKLGRFFLLYTTGLIFVGVLASQSRGGVIAMIVSFLVVFAMLRMRLSRVLPALAAVLILSVFFLMSIGPSSSIARLGTIYESLTTGFNGRDDVWESALETWKSYPVLGTGFGTYAEATSPNYKPVDVSFFDKFASHGESEYVEMLVEAGCVGLGLLFVIIFDLFRKTLIAVRQTSKGMRTLLLGCLFGVTTITTQSLADFPLHVAGVTVPAVVLASKLYRLGLCKEDEESQANRNEMNGFLPGLQRFVVTLKNIALLVTACILVPYQASQVKIERLIEQAHIPLPDAQWVTTDVPRYSRPVLETMRTALIESLKIRPDWAEGHTRLGQVQLALYRHAAAEALGITLVTFEPDFALEGNNFESREETEVTKPQPEPEPGPKTETETDSNPGDVAPPKEGTIDPAAGKIVEPATGTAGLGTRPSNISTSSGSTPGQNSSGTPPISRDENPSTINTPFGAFTLPTAKTAHQKRIETAPSTPPLGTGEEEAIPSRSMNKTRSSEKTEESAQDETFVDTLLLHKIMHALKEKESEEVERVIEHPPVRDFLIPAARSFLEARRCCPVLAVPQMQLAGLDYLLNGSETSIDYVKRAIKLKGNHPRMLLVGAQTAIDVHELDLTVEYLREYLRLRPLDWPAIASTAKDALKPAQVLDVAKGGGVKTLVPIGIRAYSSPLELIYRMRFMETALALLPTDPKLNHEERIWYEGRIRGELAQYAIARELMRKALDLQPMNEAWRLEYINALMTWGCHDEAYRLALMGSRYFPKSWRYPKLMSLNLEAANELGLKSMQLSTGDQKFDR